MSMDAHTSGIVDDALSALRPLLEPHYRAHRYAILDGTTIYAPLDTNPIADLRKQTEGTGYILATNYDPKMGGWVTGHRLGGFKTFDAVLSAATDMLGVDTGHRWHIAQAGIHRHYRGSFYKLTGMDWDTELQIPRYVYSPADDEFRVFTRMAHLFHADVRKDDGTLVPRFQYLEQYPQ